MSDPEIIYCKKCDKPWDWNHDCVNGVKVSPALSVSPMPTRNPPPSPHPPGSAAYVLTKLERDKAEMLKSGASKYDADKPRLDLLDPYAVEQLAKVLTFGAQKYAAHNWRKGLSKSRLIAAALRHIFAYLGGQNTDEETGLSHIAHAMCCCMFILGLEHRVDLDDRYNARKED